MHMVNTYIRTYSIRVPACIVCCRPIESIFEELVYEGVIIKCPKVRLSEYDGEYRYENWFVCLYFGFM